MGEREDRHFRVLRPIASLLAELPRLPTRPADPSMWADILAGSFHFLTTSADTSNMGAMRLFAAMIASGPMPTDPAAWKLYRVILKEAKDGETAAFLREDGQSGPDHRIRFPAPDAERQLPPGPNMPGTGEA